ncbi:MAG: LLM class F420-dependent oxidoreductase [Thermoprotei archaeon]|nr:MAG: LLM class F420-dependent oxidoreductase [Thermoprotei archaeon]
MTATFIYDVALEMFPPDVGLSHAVLAEKYGFEAISASDHFHPWMHTNAHSAFAWTWLGIAAERTRKSKVGTLVTAPILRYHPAIVAQAFATLGYLYPGRIFLGVGAGEAINEVPLGYKWPSPRERIERLEEALKIIRFLWEREFVNFKGKYFTLKNANLYTKPRKHKIPIYVAASGLKAASLAGKYGDGVVISSTTAKKRGSSLLNAFYKAAIDAGKNPEEMAKIVLIVTSFDEDFQKALQGIRYWASTMLRFVFKYDIGDPREIEEYASLIGDEQIASRRYIVTSPDEYYNIIEKFVNMGFNNVAILNSSPEPEKLIKIFGEKIIPYFKEVE